MKKILALLLVLATLFALTACTGEDGQIPTGDGGQTGDDLNYYHTEAKYTRDEFVEKLTDYANSHKPDKKSHYEEGYIPEEQNGFQEWYYIKDFSDEHELNLFLYDANFAVDTQPNGWLVIDRFRYEFMDLTEYSVSIFYTEYYETLQMVTANARNDAYRLAPYYGFSPDEMRFYTYVDGKRQYIELDQAACEKLVSGEYTKIVGLPNGLLPNDDNCVIEITASQTETGWYEYSCKLRLEFYE